MDEFFYIVCYDIKKEKFSVEPFNSDEASALKRVEREEYFRVLDRIERGLWIK